MNGPIRIAAGLATLALAATLGGCRAHEDRMAAVRTLQDAGRFEDSIGELRGILAARPQLPEANYRLGVALVRTGNPSRAVWALEKASESSAFAIPSNLELASVQLALDNFEESIRASGRVLEVEPEHREALSLSARAHVGARQLQQALRETSHLLERDPDDYATLVVHATVLAELGRYREAEAAHARIKQISAASGDADQAARGCLAPALFASEDLGDLERAADLYRDCASRYPGNRFVIGHVASFFDSIGEPERAIELIERAVAAAPDDLALRSSLAAHLSGLGRREEATAVLEEAVRRFGIEAAGIELVNHYRRERNSRRALELIEELTRRTGNANDRLQFVHADLLVDVGELDRAEELAVHLEDPSYTSLIRGRILLARDEPAAALAAFDAGIEAWPNNAGARYLAGVAALALGDFERAITELRESVRVDDSETNAARILARLYFDRREYVQAIAFAEIARQHAGPAQRAGDLQLEARALAASGEFERARMVIHAISVLPGRAGDAAVELAAVERRTGGPAAAVSAIEALDLDLRAPANEPALRALAADLVATERVDRAVANVERALSARPESASLHALMGATLARARRPIDARAAFERALALDANCPEALAGMAELLDAAGDSLRAVELFDRAADLEPDNADYAYAAAQRVLAAGDRHAAEARLRTIVRRPVVPAGTLNDLAWLLANDGTDLDLALSLAQEASRRRPQAATFDTLGFVYLRRGQIEHAVETLEAAAAFPGSSSTIELHLAAALSRAGATERAREVLGRVVADGDLPDAEAARR